MNRQQSTWNTFATSGKVTDYLTYCNTKDQPVSQAKGPQERGTPHDPDNGRHRPGTAQG